MTKRIDLSLSCTIHDYHDVENLEALTWLLEEIKKHTYILIGGDLGDHLNEEPATVHSIRFYYEEEDK